MCNFARKLATAGCVMVVAGDNIEYEFKIIQDMCNFNFEAQMRSLERMKNSPEMSLKVLRSIGVLDDNGDFTPDYSFLKKDAHAPAI